MSEPQPERDGTRPAQRPGQGKKILGLSQGQAIGVGAVGLVLVGYLLIRARKNAAAQAASTSAGTCPDGSSPDANGNCPQSSQDFSGALETLQSEIADLQGAMGGPGGGGTVDGTGAGSVGAATGTTTAPPTTTPATTTSASTPGAVAAKAAATAGPISDLRATQTGTTSFTVAWNPATGATGGYAYVVRDLASHTQVGQAHTTRATSATVTGLKRGTDYNFGLQALPGGAGTNLHVRTK
jgi:Fibronectin type III domain